MGVPARLRGAPGPPRHRAPGERQRAHDRLGGAHPRASPRRRARSGAHARALPARPHRRGPANGAALGGDRLELARPGPPRRDPHRLPSPAHRRRAEPHQRHRPRPSERLDRGGGVLPGRGVDHRAPERRADPALRQPPGPWRRGRAGALLPPRSALRAAGGGPPEPARVQQPLQADQSCDRARARSGGRRRTAPRLVLLGPGLRLRLHGQRRAAARGLHPDLQLDAAARVRGRRGGRARLGDRARRAGGLSVPRHLHRAHPLARAHPQRAPPPHGGALGLPRDRRQLAPGRARVPVAGRGSPARPLALVAPRPGPGRPGRARERAPPRPRRGPPASRMAPGGALLRAARHRPTPAGGEGGAARRGLAVFARLGRGSHDTGPFGWSVRPAGPEPREPIP